VTLGDCFREAAEICLRYVVELNNHGDWPAANQCKENAKARLASQPEGAAERNLIDLIIRDVAELPDRNSPDDWPEAMLVTGDELRNIIEDRIISMPASQPEAAQDGWRLVPVEPTAAMIQAWNGCDSIEEGWAAMLASAPQTKGGERE
jgi:hypothetical protein